MPFTSLLCQLLVAPDDSSEWVTTAQQCPDVTGQ